jgi:hypothetical protein
MNKRKILIKLVIGICLLGIILVAINWITGFINPKITAGASALCIGALLLNLEVLISKLRDENRLN